MFNDAASSPDYLTLNDTIVIGIISFLGIMHGSCTNLVIYVVR
jgi:hypothetical protein